MRSCFNQFKACEKIMLSKTNWTSERARIDFVCGTNTALAGFELCISYFHPGFIRLLQFIGHGADRPAALERLKSVENYQESTSYSLVSLGLGIYYGFIVYFYGIGESDYYCLKRLAEYWTEKAPDSFVIAIVTGVRDMVNGDLDPAIENFDQFINHTHTIKSLRFAGNWLNNWIYSLKWDWKSAAYHSESLYLNCKWAPATFAFIHASNLSMIAREDNNNTETMEQVIELLNETIKREMKFGGQKVFHINFVVEKARFFIDNPHKIILLPLHLMYLWNYFSIGLKQGCLKMIREKIDEEMKDISDVDTCTFLKFIKGVTFSYDNLISQAMECFNHVLNQ